MVSDELPDPDSLMVWPGKIFEDSDKLFAVKMVERLVPLRAAMPDKVSPDLTV